MIFSNEDYASHQPVLYAYAMMMNNSRIIEYGAGDYSTPMLHDICEKNGNTLVTVDNDDEWLDRYRKSHPGFHWHSYVHVKDYTDLLDIHHDFKCELAFIDGYTWGTRLFCMKESFDARVPLVIVHDCDFFDGHEEIVAQRPYEVYNTRWPPTAVFGTKINIDWGVNNAIQK